VEIAYIKKARSVVLGSSGQFWVDLGNNSRLCPTEYCKGNAHVALHIVILKVCNSTFVEIIRSPFSVLANCCCFSISVMCLWH